MKEGVQKTINFALMEVIEIPGRDRTLSIVRYSMCFSNRLCKEENFGKSARASSDAYAKS
jgi:hypothetical protein